MMPKQNVPALRLHGFSGEWETVSLDELQKRRLVTLGRGEVISQIDINAHPGNYPIYSSSAKNDGLFGRYGRYMFSDERITWSIDGGGQFFYRSAHRYSVTNVCGWMKINTNTIDTSFLYLALYLQWLEQSFDYSVKAHPSNIVQIYNPHFPPTLEEQQAIGAIFTNLDAAINQHTLKHKSLQQSKTALMQRMFPQEGQTVPELRLEGFSGEWEPVTFGELSGRTYGGGTPSSDEPSYWSGDIPWIQSSDVAEDGVAPVVPRKHITREAISCSATMQIPANSVAVVTRVGVGKVSFMPYSYATSQDFVSLSDLSGHPEYIALTVKRRMEGLADQLQGSTIKGITKVELLNQSVHFPPTLEEQQAIGAIFTNLDQLIAAEAQYIASLKQAKTALLQRMFI